MGHRQELREYILHKTITEAEDNKLLRVISNKEIRDFKLKKVLGALAGAIGSAVLFKIVGEQGDEKYFPILLLIGTFFGNIGGEIAHNIKKKFSSKTKLVYTIEEIKTINEALQDKEHVSPDRYKKLQRTRKVLSKRLADEISKLTKKDKKDLNDIITQSKKL